jgi:hypothetical protein
MSLQRWRATERVIDSAVVADMVKTESDGYYLADEVDKKIEALADKWTKPTEAEDNDYDKGQDYCANELREKFK